MKPLNMSYITFRPTLTLYSYELIDNLNAQRQYETPNDPNEHETPSESAHMHLVHAYSDEYCYHYIKQVVESLIKSELK